MAQRALFLRWALFASLIAVGLLTAVLTGGFSILAKHDPTYVSFLILAVMVAATAWCGRLTYRLEVEKEQGWTDGFKRLHNDATHGPIAANICTLLGLLGTGIGMIIMFYAATKGLGVSVGANDVGAYKGFMKTLLTGLWPAFIANAAGIFAALIIVFQYHFLSHAITEAELEAEEMPRDTKGKKP